MEKANKEKKHSSSLGEIKRRALAKELRLDELLEGIEAAYREIILLNFTDLTSDMANAIVNESWKRFKEKIGDPLDIIHVDGQEKVNEVEPITRERLEELLRNNNLGDKT